MVLRGRVDRLIVLGGGRRRFGRGGLRGSGGEAGGRQGEEGEDEKDAAPHPDFFLCPTSTDRNGQGCQTAQFGEERNLGVVFPNGARKGSASPPFFARPAVSLSLSSSPSAAAAAAAAQVKFTDSDRYSSTFLPPFIPRSFSRTPTTAEEDTRNRKSAAPASWKTMEKTKLVFVAISGISRGRRRTQCSTERFLSS